METEIDNRLVFDGMSMNLPFGEILHMLRQRPDYSLSLEELSEKTGIPTLILVAYQRDMLLPSSDHLQKLAAAFQFPLEILENYLKKVAL